MRTKASELESLRPTLARMVVTAAQGAIPANAWTVINLNGATYDLGENCDFINHAYIVPEDGYYFCHGVTSYGGLGANWNASTYAGIAKNGAVIAQGAAEGQTTSNGYLDAEVTDVIQCNKGDKITLLTIVTSAWSLYLNDIFLTIYKVV